MAGEKIQRSQLEEESARPVEKREDLRKSHWNYDPSFGAFTGNFRMKIRGGGETSMPLGAGTGLLKGLKKRREDENFTTNIGTS